MVFKKPWHQRPEQMNLRHHHAFACGAVPDGGTSFLNADHTHSLSKAVEAAKARFDAIVFDLSPLPFEENVRQTKEAVGVLKSINPDILVEGEIGDIGTGSEIHDKAPDLAKGLTTPAQAKEYVESTGTDVLAPAVGNMHGMLKSMVRGETKKHLDIPKSLRSRAPRRCHLRFTADRGPTMSIFARQLPQGSISSISTPNFGSHGDVVSRKAWPINPGRLSHTRFYRSPWSR
jgi:hypothetical protein